MSNIIVSPKILMDAYNNVFINLERMNYVQASKLIEFVEQYDYPTERDMIDYAKVIIYSNTNKLEEAIKLSEAMLNRGVVLELQTIVKEVHTQLIKQNEKFKKKKKNDIHIPIEQVYKFLDDIKPSDSKFVNFIEVFSPSSEDENNFIAYYKNNAKLDEKSEFVSRIKKLCIKKNVIEKSLNDISLDEKAKSLYIFLNKFLLSLYNSDELLLFLNLHKTNIIKKILIDESFDARVRSFLSYQIDELYAYDVIGRVKIKMLINNKIYEEYISKLNAEFNQSIIKYEEEMEYFFNNANLNVEDETDILTNFQRVMCYTYPVVNPMGIELKKFIASFLYLTSNYNFNRQFNDIIYDVYKFSENDLKVEMQMIEIIILI